MRSMLFLSPFGKGACYYWEGIKKLSTKSSFFEKWTQNDPVIQSPHLGSAPLPIQAFSKRTKSGIRAAYGRGDGTLGMISSSLLKIKTDDKDKY